MYLGRGPENDLAGCLDELAEEEASRTTVISARKYRYSLASLTVTAPVAITTAARGPGSAFWLRRSAP